MVGNRKKGSDRKPTRKTNYITHTDLNEYFKTLEEYDKDVKKYYQEKKKRGRPKKFPDQPMKRTIGEFILTFD
jgi:hypothetical protein|tara:strand:- start:601 stop:819 length:219 start_codon:yes stop_codon:yes gene_type:complete